ncbi:MAG: DUF6111 family protein [Alphaproteobacteria bacterium]|jgi:hypothetical protein|nr:hypothetical protein [Rhodospirillaceae bacterium]MDG2482435.1 DUF6111 family protein [Alphaproteobacteria bacterium]MBT6202926.1 hypothetical protein [Rhodospirillaceae bacterium]MBT6509279.1 hypothetical protein [Rhodospirillaceae bacterium]MBT7614970.1 hypothetical protein [Rhodospirillaceae bacterium]
MRFLLPVLLIFVPLIAYMIWFKLARETAEQEGDGTLPHWREAPWTWIVAGTLGLVCVALIALGLLSGDPPGKTYVPAKVIDGEVVPGHFDE